MSVADGGDGLQMWNVANILSKQWRTADKVWFGRRANNSSPQKIKLLRNIIQYSDKTLV